MNYIGKKVRSRKYVKTPIDEFLWDYLNKKCGNKLYSVCMNIACRKDLRSNEGKDHFSFCDDGDLSNICRECNDYIRAQVVNKELDNCRRWLAINLGYTFYEPGTLGHRYVNE